MGNEKIHLNYTVGIQNNMHARILATYTPADKGMKGPKAAKKFKKLVEEISKALNTDASNSLAGETFADDDGWEITYEIEYLTALDILKEDPKIKALLAADALHEMNGALYIWEGLNPQLLYELKINCNFFCKEEYRGLIFTRNGEIPTYNTVKHYMDSLNK